MTKNDYKHALRTFIAEHIHNHEIGDDEDIFMGGFVTSMFAMQLVLLIEDQLKIRLTNQDLKLENFRTINQMVALIERKLATN